MARHRGELQRRAGAQHRVTREQCVEAGAREARVVHVEEQRGSEMAHALPVGEAVGQRAVDEQELVERAEELCACAAHVGVSCACREVQLLEMQRLGLELAQSAETDSA